MRATRLISLVRLTVLVSWLALAPAAQGAGELDTSFDGDGKVLTDFGGPDEGWAVAVQGDGKIVMAGSTTTGTAVDFALARYNADGSLDTSFDGDGKVVTDFGGGDVAVDVAIQSDGKIVAAGSSGQRLRGCALQRGRQPRHELRRRRQGDDRLRRSRAAAALR